MSIFSSNLKKLSNNFNILFSMCKDNSKNPLFCNKVMQFLHILYEYEEGMKKIVLFITPEDLGMRYVSRTSKGKLVLEEFYSTISDIIYLLEFNNYI